MFRKSPWHFLNTKRFFFLITGAGFLFKYWLVLGDEIEPFYHPGDDFLYVRLAESWYWWADYNEWSFLRPPVWPLFLSIIKVSGLPLRIVQELMLCGCTFFVTNRFRKIGLNATLAGLSFSIIILHPGWLLLANKTLTESLYVSLMLVLVGQLIPLASRRLNDLRWNHMLPVGITSALIWHTREETVVIIAMLGAFVVIFWLFMQQLPPTTITLKRLGAVLTGVVLPILATNLVIRITSYATHGLFITHEFADPAFKKAHKSLMQIKPEKPKPWVTIERESLEKAYEASPTFASIKEALSDRVGPRWAAVTQNLAADPEEIGGCGSLFAFREAAAEEGFHSDPLKAHAFYSDVARELQEGFKDGRLKKRFAFSSYIDPEVSDYFPRIPAGLRHVGSFAFAPIKDNDIRIYYPRHEVERTLNIYDKVTNRRKYLAYRKVYSIRGWAFVEGKEASSISILDGNGYSLDHTAQITERPDVAKVYDANNAPLHSGFTISLPKADYPNSQVQFVFKTVDGKSISMLASRLLKHGQEQISNNAGEILRVTVDEISSDRDRFAIQNSIQTWLWLHHGKFHLVFASLALTTLLIRLGLFKTKAQSIHYYRWIIFILFVVLLRWFLITLFDISSFRIDLRYIFPALVFLPLLFALILQEALVGFKTNRMRW